MKIASLSAKNFRSLEDFSVDFSDNFTAISGKNDSGKSNIFEAIKLLIGSNRYEMYSPVTIDFDNDYPKWKDPKSGDDSISVSGRFTLEDQDSAIKNFIQRQLSLDSNKINEFSLEVSVSRGRSQHQVKVSALGKIVEGEPAQEVWGRLRSEASLVFHNSTTDGLRLSYGGGHGQFSEISQSVTSIMAQIRTDIAKKLKKTMASSQNELQGLLGRLSDKWKVSLDLPEFDASVPFNLVLGDNAVSVPLNSWGSGTKNRAMIILALLRAAQFRKIENETGRLIPVVVIEEPESFLHPSAQAEFGSLLIDLAAELDIQVIVSTHSVYLLNTAAPESNILVCRRRFRNQSRESYIEIASPEQWMKPFSVALGLSSESLAPWRSILEVRGKKIILVEGETDKRYLTLLQRPEHGSKSIDRDWIIISYNGFGNITNQSALRVMLELAGKAVITVDFDALSKVEGTFKSLELKKGKDYLPVGIDKSGKRAIEGLLPDSIRQKVLANNPNLFEGLLDRTTSDKGIRSRIKSAYLEEFEKHSKPGPDFDGFYKLGESLKRAFS
ncbi:ATP-dependent nuclease [Sphingomonas flavalba]|uniref:ATP-dependent nuclease n=1 Tax=Sphingomonas flavalba TaxID=2559804 RepID=UPI0039DF3796